MKIKLSDYMPSPDELAVADILDARSRLAVYLATWYPELDTRPNSVFGDLHLTPLSIMMAGAEVGLERILSDINLSNPARGVIYNETFLRGYLESLGLFASGGVQSSGVIKLKFSANKSYVIDNNNDFIFNARTFKVATPESEPVTIYPTGSNAGAHVLSKEREGEFVVYLPVTGVAGATVSGGAIGQSDITYAELMEITAAGDFDAGTPQESLSSLARKASQGFASANLTSRAGAISFLASFFPQMTGASVTMTGDLEMIRDGTNPLGVAEGAVDVFIKSRPRYASGAQVTALVWDADQQGWTGRLELPVTPAFFDIKAGIFQVGNFKNSRGVNTVYAASSHPDSDNSGVAYSKFEILGVLIQDTNPTDFLPSSIGVIQQLSGDDSIFQVSGDYSGYVLSSRTSRDVTLRFDSTTTINGHPAAVAAVRDNLSGDTGLVYFVGDTLVNPTHGVIYRDINYKPFFNGLEIKIRPRNNIFDPSSLVGNTYSFGFSGKTANFSVNYLYDPALLQVQALLEDDRFRPAAVSILTKSFIICYISTFTVNYRVAHGADVDLVAAAQAIYDYVNSLAYPNLYEESRIGEIMIQNGASGMQSVTQRGTFYPSLATQFIDQGGNVTPIARADTTTLNPAINDFGYGIRNVAYLLDLETIHFNVQVI